MGENAKLAESRVDEHYATSVTSEREATQVYTDSSIPY